MLHNQDIIGYFQESPYRDSIVEIQKLVPPNEKLSVTNNIAPQFAQRDRIWGFPNWIEKADGIIVLEGSEYEQATKEQVNQKVNELLVNPDWKLMYQRSAIYYFRRVQKTPAL
jgi:hypothetical protein